MGDSTGEAGHAFVSYVREDTIYVDRLQRMLVEAGIPVWRDTANLWPGDDWRVKIRDAIRSNALVFLACFSEVSIARRRSFQEAELRLAIEEFHQRRSGIPWLIPVRFDDCDVPDWDIGGGNTLASIQSADIFEENFAEGAARLAASVLRLLEPAGDTVRSNASVSEGTRSGESHAQRTKSVSRHVHTAASDEISHSAVQQPDPANSRRGIANPTRPGLSDDDRYRQNGLTQTGLRHRQLDNQFNKIDGGIVASIVIVFSVGFAYHWVWLVVPGIGVVFIAYTNIRHRRQ